MQYRVFVTRGERSRAIFLGRLLSFALVATALAMPALAVQMQSAGQRSSRLLVVPQAVVGLDVQPDLQASQSLQSLAPTHTVVAKFLSVHGGQWEWRMDRRSGQPNLVQGSGIPLFAGAGNALLPASAPRNRPAVGQSVQQFVRANQDLLGVAGIDLRVDEANSTPYGNGDRHWFLQLDQYSHGVRVKGANVFVRISNGNVVQFGNNRVVPVQISTRPKLGQRAGLNALMSKLRFMPDTHITRLLNSGELLVVPRAADRKSAGLRFSGAIGSGYTHVLAWHYTFRVNDDPTTYDVLVDANSGQVLSVDNLTVNAQAQVKGNVYTTDHITTQSVGMPFANVSNNGSKTTDLAGQYNYSGGTASVALDGKYFRIVDNCGSISFSNSTDGNLDLGANTGTDCTTPGFGGAGNTNASRSAFYNLTLINRKASTFYPSNGWLQGKVTAEVNENDTCNAFWDGSSLNFFKSSPGQCANTGEIPGVFLHEWGHGMDTNSGGSAPGDYGSGEAVGDTFAMLETKESCIGMGFFTNGSTCYNCNTSCTGVRDAAAFSLDGPASNVIASPATITDNNGVNADRLSCPYFTPEGYAYQGPMGYEGHQESYIASSANWDLAQALVAEYGTDAGWQQMDTIWYGSLYPSKSAYQVVSGGKCNVNATVDGCGADNWYTVYLAADDDDGNLANGTPNACRIWDAFDAHGIACGTRPVCTPTTPDFTLSAATVEAEICAGGSQDLSMDVGSAQGFSNAVTLSTGALATGLSASFSPNPVTPGNTANVHLAATAGAAAGDYTVTAMGTASNSPGHSLDFALKVFGGSPAVPALIAPADGAGGQSTDLELSWNAVAAAASYGVEVATDAAFTNIVDSQTGLTATSYRPAGLAPNTTYHWRITAANTCGSTPPASASFTTANMICSSPAVAIPDGDSNGVADVIHMANPSQLDGMKLTIKATHAWVGDLKFTLSHAGTDVLVINRVGVGGSSSYGCDQSDVDVTLDDAATTSVQDQCNSSTPAIGGLQQPNQALAAFTGMAASGDWTLTVADEVGYGTGTLDQWCLLPDVETTTFAVGGMLTGLNGNVTLQLNGANDLSLAADGNFSFSQGLFDHSAYSVSVVTQPDQQICTVAQASGTVNGGPVTDIDVSCADNAANTWYVGGAVSGLDNGQSLAVQLNGGNDIQLTANGGFTFAQGLATSDSYTVAVSAQPNGQFCTVSRGSGSIASSNVIDVAVVCGDPPPPEWIIGGRVTGLTGSGLVLQLDAANDLAITGNGAFSFGHTVTDGTAWIASIATQPSGQTCQIGNVSGTAASDVTDIEVQCIRPEVTDRLFADGFDPASVPYVQPVLDPGFEATTATFGSNPNWDGSDSHSAGSTPFCDGACSQDGVIPTQDGDWAVWFGAWDAATASQMKFSQQSVVISSGGPRYLRYWRFLARVPDGITTMKILVDGDVARNVDLTVLAADADFTQRSMDVSAWADDAAHTISFEFDNDASGSTDGSLFIDTVSIGDQPLMPAASTPLRSAGSKASRNSVRRR